MNKILKLVFCLFLFAQPPVFGQHGYVKSDSVFSQGKVFDRGLYNNNRQVQIREGKKVITYLPSQLIEYGINKYNVYVKRAVATAGAGEKTDYFLLRLVDGERRLFQLREKGKSRFFIEHDNSLVEIRKDQNLSEQLSRELNACNANGQIIRLARYNRASLSRAVALSNKCYTGFFPRLRKGLVLGYESTSQQLMSTFYHTNLQSTGVSPSIGIFVDFPFLSSNNWFVTLQPTYQENNFGGTTQIGSQTFDYQYNFSTLSFPMLIKYRSKSKSLRPFVGLGPVPALFSQQENKLLVIDNIGAISKISERSLDNQRSVQLSGAFSIGAEYSLNMKSAIGLEIRAKKLLNVNGASAQTIAIVGSYYF